MPKSPFQFRRHRPHERRSLALFAGVFCCALPLWAIPAMGQAQAACDLSAVAAAGQDVARNCKGCHVFEPGRESRPTGPNLAAIYGAQAGSAEDFRRYSEGIRALAKQGVRWTEENLDAYIKDPEPFIQDRTGRTELRHGMLFKLPDPSQRAQVIAYLKALKDCQP